MHWRIRSIGLVVLAGAAVALAIFGAALWGESVIAGSSRADLENTCTIDAQAVYEGITLDRSVPAGNLASVAEGNALAAEPGATVMETQTGRAASDTIPVVNGHNVVLVRLANVAPVMMGGPAGTAATKAAFASPSCDIAIYDADTGDLLVEMKTVP